MTRGRGVRLQRYKEKGLSDVTTFKADEGLTWIDGAGRTQTLSMKELKDWRGNRADAGRIAQGLPKNNKFRGAPTGGKGGEGRGITAIRAQRTKQRDGSVRGRRAVRSQLATNSSEHSASFQQRRGGIAEEQFFAGPAADAHHDQIVLAARRLVRGWLRPAASSASTAVRMLML